MVERNDQVAREWRRQVHETLLWKKETIKWPENGGGRYMRHSCGRKKLSSGQRMEEAGT